MTDDTGLPEQDAPQGKPQAPTNVPDDSANDAPIEDDDTPEKPEAHDAA